MNLLERLHQEIERAERIQELYLELPDGAGTPGAELIRGMVNRARLSMQSGSLEDMSEACRALEEVE